MTTAVTQLPVADGRGSVSEAPNLPDGFADTFTSRYVDIGGGLRLHAVIGGDGPPLLLIHGWPQTWYAWRMVMPTLARDFEVVAVDQRGIGLSDKPHDGYDIGTLGNDLVALMDALGHQRFAVYGTDTGMPIASAPSSPRRRVRRSCPTRPSSTTSRPWLRARKPCVAASSSTVRFRRQLRRTRSARADGFQCQSLQSVAPRVGWKASKQR